MREDNHAGKSPAERRIQKDEYKPKDLDTDLLTRGERETTIGKAGCCAMDGGGQETGVLRETNGSRTQLQSTTQAMTDAHQTARNEPGAARCDSPSEAC